MNHTSAIQDEKITQVNAYFQYEHGINIVGQFRSKLGLVSVVCWVNQIKTSLGEKLIMNRE